MRTLTIFLAVLFTLLALLALRVNGEENLTDTRPLKTVEENLTDTRPLTTVVIISARYGEDYKLTGLTYGQYKEIKTAIKTVNDLKKKKHIYGIDHYNALFSTVLSGLKAKGITVTEI